MKKELLKAIIEGNVRKFYKSIEWIKKRAEILLRDNNECQKCKKKGLFSLAECVHHIKHLKSHPELALTDSNLISLCNACHNEEHPEKLKKIEPKKKFSNEERWE
ncbi:HNH endonuclease [Natronincola peptidivorans]|uniref:Putative HNH nuclease YajD n=1 Tax=Natronincola peptidivorans TaxID=426128 RepID=A0A1I0FF39_9FIRM|nr:HNH endonuclease [Natronincola peptidivorans]SET55818.1 HNH endonuclease [Natronincola peptidivorans]